MFDAVKDLVGGGLYELKEALDWKKQRESEQEPGEAGGTGEQQAADRNKKQVDASLATHDPVAMENAPQGVARTIEMDVERVQLEISRIPDKVFRMMKNAALANPVQREDIKGATRRKFYGSPHHKEYGAYVELLTGGRITAEEAMRMNPSGGIAGPALLGIAFDSGVLHEHAIRHDATGFLMTAFNIGPGYGGRDGGNMYNGQIEGIAREMMVGKSKLPSIDGVGAPSRE